MYPYLPIGRLTGTADCVKKIVLSPCINQYVISISKLGSGSASIRIIMPFKNNKKNHYTGHNGIHGSMKITAHKIERYTYQEKDKEKLKNRTCISAWSRARHRQTNALEVGAERESYQARGMLQIRDACVHTNTSTSLSVQPQLHSLSQLLGSTQHRNIVPLATLRAYQISSQFHLIAKF